MSFPVEKYHFYTYAKKGRQYVCAVSSYAGRKVRGVAICSGKDTYDIEKGKLMAAARCEEKVAEKRLKRSIKKVAEAKNELDKVQKHFAKMTNYNDDAATAFIKAQQDRKNLENTL